MCKRLTLVSLLAFVLGAVVLAAGGWYGATRLMVLEADSPLGFEETVAAISDNAQAQGWLIPKVHKLDQGLAQHGHQVRPVAVIELCQPDYAAALLQHDATRMVSSFMPCRVSVYETADGSVTVSRMNAALMSRLFPAEVAQVMAQAGAETELILNAVLEAG